MTDFQVSNALKPSREQLVALATDGKEDPARGPVYMVNLLEFSEKPRYPDGTVVPEGIETGRAAYYRYLEEAQDPLESVGGQLVYAGKVSALRVGRVESMWDEIAILRFPSPAHWAALIQNPDWQKAAIHRQAGLEGQLNFETLASTDPVHVDALVK